jgi:hypothetical protein
MSSDPKILAAVAAENFAVKTMITVQEAYRERNRGAIRGHITSLELEAERTEDPNIKFAVEEAKAILVLLKRRYNNP